MKTTMKMKLQHSLNALHVRCKLQRFISKDKAKRIAMRYEKIVHPILYFEYGQALRLIGSFIVLLFFTFLVWLIQKFEESRLGKKLLRK